MRDSICAHAPYNFIPISKKPPIIRYRDMKDLPRHDVFDPKLKTGEIHVTMTAETPVLVCRKPEGRKPITCSFFKNAAGQYSIPGSTIRGMVRANMHILGFALMRLDTDVKNRIKDTYWVSMHKGFPKSHQNYVVENKRFKHSYEMRPRTLDYPLSILGFSERKTWYRSRVSFGEFQTIKHNRDLEPEIKKVSVMFRTPKPLCYPLYTEDGIPYTDHDFQIRGRKLYWLRDTPITSTGTGLDMYPLPVGTQFRGVIRYRNLTEDELGLLLWCLRLDEGCYQSIGMGKPYGYGRMSLTIDALQEFDPGALYADLCCGAKPASKDAIEHYIASYDAYAAKKLAIQEPEHQPSLRSCPEIQDFFYMRRTLVSGSQFDYMKPWEDIDEPLPDVRSFYTEPEPEPEPEPNPDLDGKSMDELLKMLKDKTNQKKI